MVLGALGKQPLDEMWWYYLIMTTIYTAAISEIYFFRVVLTMMRECRHTESKTAQQAVSSDGHKPSSSVTSTDSAADAH
jgi:NADH:ubiquinone oxidoreductase subunit 2 (subunit N)